MAKSKKVAMTGQADGELGLIAGIRERAVKSAAKAARLRLGIGDDCAILRPKTGDEIVVTTDLTLEDVHFRREWHSPESVGHRCLARGLSDLAAMGAKPMAAFVSLGLPAELTGGKGSAGDGARTRPTAGRSWAGYSWMERFYDGLLALAERNQVPLAGGDLAQSKTVVADIVLIGSVPRGRALLRSGAKAGDAIYVTGALGGAAAELMALERDPKRFARAKPGAAHPHLYPEPRLAVGQWLAGHGTAKRRLARVSATSAIDVSDGLSVDLAHLCEESGVAAEIDAAGVPVHLLAVLASGSGWVWSAMELALHGGEDYELLFTARPDVRVPPMITGVPVRRIGRIVNRRASHPMVEIVEEGVRKPLVARGWEHFKSQLAR